MALIGTREDWGRLAHEDAPGVWPLKDEHVACIEAALAAASADATTVKVDAAPVALRQTVERLPDRGEGHSVRAIGAAIADSDERWWLLRAYQVGLGSIRPVEPWPRVPHPEWRMPAAGEGWGTPILREDLSDLRGPGDGEQGKEHG